MKKIFLLFGFFLCASSLYAAVIIRENPLADSIMLPLFNSGKMISLSKLMGLTPSEYKIITGKKMSFKEKIYMKIFQHYFKNSINSDGTVNPQKFNGDGNGYNRSRFGWFAIGFYGSFLGVLVTLFMHDEYRKPRIREACIGFLAMLVLAGLIVSAYIISFQHKR